MSKQRQTEEPLAPENKAISETNPSAGTEQSETARNPQELTPDEQMALFEKDLKENDWGHQPC